MEYPVTERPLRDVLYSDIDLKVFQYLKQEQEHAKQYEEEGHEAALEEIAAFDIHAMAAARLLGIDPRNVTHDQRVIAKEEHFKPLYKIILEGE